MAFNNLINRYFMATSQTGGGATPEDVQNQNALNDALQSTRDLAFEIKNAFGSLASETEGVFNNAITGQRKLDKETKKYYTGIAKDVTKNLKAQRYETDEINKLINKQSSGSLRLKDINNALEKSKQRQQSIEDSIKEAIIEGIVNEEQIIDIRERITAETEKQKTLLKQLAKEAERQEKALGLTYRIFDGISKIPILNSLIKVEKVKEAMEEAAGEGKKTWSVFGTGVKETFSQIGKTLTDPLAILSGIGAIFSFMLKSALELDKHLVEFGKNVSLSSKASKVLASNFEESSKHVAQYSKYLSAGTFSVKAQMEATKELNESLGTSELFTEKMLAGQVLLTKRLGLNNEEASEFAKFSLLSGKSQEDITTEVGDQIVEFKKQTGVQLNMKKVMQDVTKIHGQLAANLGNDPKRIAAAVMQAQKLGLSLEKTKDIANSLLNFESSIENELEAELLTGKSLNLERARELALQGKSAEAAAELMNQVGGLSEFQSLNVLQQNALAKSVGLTADEMADAYKQQELLKGTGFESIKAFNEQRKIAEENGKLAEFEANVKRAANGDELLAMAEKQSRQDSFNDTIEKLKESLNKIAGGPLLDMVDRFSKFLEDGENIKKVVEWMKGAFEGLKLVLGFIVANQIVGMISGLGKMLKVVRAIKVEEIGVAIGKAWGAAMSGPESILTGGIAGAAIAAVLTAGIISAVNSNSQSVEDAAISPSGGLMISGPKGSFITDPADEIVAAPGASRMLGGGGGITKADLDAIANRPVMVSVQANTDTLLRLQTAQTQYGAPSSFA